MEVVQVDQYSSDLSDEEVLVENKEKHKKKRRTRFWFRKAVFDNAAEAEASIGNGWSKHYINYTESGRKVYYRCTKTKLRGSPCSAGVYLLYHAENDQISVYQTEDDHDHHEEKVRGIDANTKKCIKDLFNDGIFKPKQIIRALQTRNFTPPSYVQLKNFLVQYKRTKFGSHIVSLGELQHWCEQNIDIPTDENKCFVVSYKIMYDDEEDEAEEDEEDNNERKFRIFLSSVRLLNIASISLHIHADATYKLIWQGFPMLIVGTTDLNKVFHPFGLAICLNEKTKDFEFIFRSIQIGLEKIKKDLLKPSALVSDVADSIKNGFKNVFKNDYNQIMCWSHMKRNVQNHISHINGTVVADEIMNDIEMLQLSNSSSVFELALTLFIKKWKIKNKQKDQSIIDFLNYFENEWIKSNNGWYEGIQLYTPSTNNGLEATNKVIKDDGTFRERHVLSRFLVIASNIINNWSVERDPSSINAKIFSIEPSINLNLWTTAYHWAKSPKEVICVENDIVKQYFIPARDLESISRTDLNKYTNKKWTTLNQFKKSFDIWCLEVKNDSDWKTSTCTCPAFLKNYICKHIVGMAIRLKLWKPPPAAKAVPVGEKRKRGRPAKARRALLMQ